jgi:Tol biopolymer transport system component
LDCAATTAAITEHYNRNQDRAEDETTGSGVRLRFIAFSSVSPFGSQDTKNQEDVFVYDTETGLLERITDGAPSMQPSISPDGRYVAYASFSNDLVIPKTVENNNDILDIFLYDRQLRTTTQITRAVGERNGNNLFGATLGHSFYPKVSGDGKFVVFESESSNLVSEDSNGFRDVFLWNRLSGRLQRISEGFYGEPNGPSNHVSISDDGTLIAFSSLANNLLWFSPDGSGEDPYADLNQNTDVFVYNNYSVFSYLTSPSLRPGNPNGYASFSPLLTPDGQTLIFTSNTPDLDPNDSDLDFDIIFFDTDVNNNRPYRRINVRDDSGSRIIGFGETIQGTSADGQYIVFRSGHPNIVANDTNQKPDVFIFDSISERVEILAKSQTGLLGNDDTSFVAISGSGQTVSFLSNATNLVTSDSNRTSDVFFVDNPLSLGSKEINLKKGQKLDDIHFGLLPRSGSIRGTVFFRLHFKRNF